MPDVYGGAEKQCRRLSKYLADSDLEITILTSRKKLKIAANEYEEQVNVKRIYTGIAPDLLGRWLLFSIYWFFAVIVWALFNRKSFDVVHCHQGKFGAFVGCCVGKLLGKPVLIKIGNSEQYMDLTCLKKKKLIGPLCTKFIVWANPTFVAITDVIAKNLKDFGCKAVVTIHNGIDVSLASPPEYKSSISTSSEASVNLFYHGRIEDIKRPEVLLQAFDLAWQKNSQLVLHVLGDGAALAASKHYAEQLKSKQAIKFYGAVDDVVAVIKQFDVFVNASEAEGFSNSLLEALLQRKVMVSTPVSGASDAILQGENGFVASDFKAKSLSDAMLSGVALYEGSQKSVAQVCATLIDEKFKMPVIVKQYKNLYKKMLMEQS